MFSGREILLKSGLELSGNLECFCDHINVAKFKGKLYCYVSLFATLIYLGITNISQIGTSMFLSLI